MSSNQGTMAVQISSKASINSWWLQELTINGGKIDAEIFHIDLSFYECMKYMKYMKYVMFLYVLWWPNDNHLLLSQSIVVHT